MTLQRARDESESTAVTSIDEIRLRKGMPFEEFCEQHPWWEWTESRLARRMIDDQGRAWVPMWEPDPGVGICYDPELTPAGEEFIAELSRKAMAEVLAGGGDIFDPNDADDD